LIAEDKVTDKEWNDLDYTDLLYYNTIHGSSQMFSDGSFEYNSNIKRKALKQSFFLDRDCIL